MPPKYKKYRKSKRYLKKRRYIRRKKIRRSKPGVMTHLGHNLTLPKYMMIKQQFQFQGYIPSGVASGYFDVAIDDADSPLDVTYGTTSKFTSSNNGSGVLLAGLSLAQNSQNYLTLSAIYPQQRVLKAKLSICMIPQALTDAVNIYITPYVYNYNNFSNSDLPVNDISQALAPRCKNKQCVANVASQSRNTIHYAIGVNTVYGVPRMAVLTEDDYLTSSNTNLAFFRVFWTTNDAVNLSTNLPVHLKYTLITKFESQNNLYQQ